MAVEISKDLQDALLSLKSGCATLSTMIVRMGDQKIISSTESLVEWKNKLVDIAKETAMMYKEQELVNKEVSNLRTQTSDVPAVEVVEDKIKNELSKVDIESNEHVRDVKMKLKITGSKRARQDDEIEEVEQEATERSYICPFSAKRFTCPMKK